MNKFILVALTILATRDRLWARRSLNTFSIVRR